KVLDFCLGFPLSCPRKSEIEKPAVAGLFFCFVCLTYEINWNMAGRIFRCLGRPRVGGSHCLRGCAWRGPCWQSSPPSAECSGAGALSRLAQLTFCSPHTRPPQKPRNKAQSQMQTKRSLQYQRWIILAVLCFA